MINIGVIGYGYWGPNLVRNFAELGGATVAGVADQLADHVGRRGHRGCTPLWRDRGRAGRAVALA